MKTDVRVAGSSVESQVHAYLARFASMSMRALPHMFYRDGEHSGLHAFKVVPDGQDGWKKTGVSLRYSLMAWIGLFGVPEAQAAANPDWPLARNRIQAMIDRGCEQFSAGDLGLALWLDSLAGCGWAPKLQSAVQGRWHSLSQDPDSFELGLLLSGLVDSDAESMISQLTRAVLRTYNPATRLFAFRSYRPAALKWTNRYHHVLGSFASQVYPLLGLSRLLTRLADSGSVKSIVRDAVNGLCELQGPNGEWWWIYDVRSRKVIADYPVYSVHQDAMGPMAILAAMTALKDRSLFPSVLRSVRWIEEYRCPVSGEGMVDPSGIVIWRAAIRSTPGVDVADLSFGLDPLHMDRVRRSGQPAFLAPKPLSDTFPETVLKEARPYCPGWMLLAYTLYCGMSSTHTAPPHSP